MDEEEKKKQERGKDNNRTRKVRKGREQKREPGAFFVAEITTQNKQYKKPRVPNQCTAMHANVPSCVLIQYNKSDLLRDHWRTCYN